MTRIIAMSTFPETFVLIKAILRKPDGKKISKNGVYIDIDLYRTCLHFLSRRIYDFILICSSITLFISPRSSVGGNCFFFKNLQTSVKFFTAKHEKCQISTVDDNFCFPIIGVKWVKMDTKMNFLLFSENLVFRFMCLFVRSQSTTTTQVLHRSTLISKSFLQKRGLKQPSDILDEVKQSGLLKTLLY